MARSVRKFSQTLSLQSLFSIRIRSNHAVQVSLVVIAVLALACLHIWQRVRVMTLVHETALMRKANHQLVDVTTKVQDDIALLSGATRIERYAQDTLHMIRVPAERLYTLIPEHQEHRPVDELSKVFSSIRRVADNLPIITEAQATAGELQLNLEDLADTTRMNK